MPRLRPSPAIVMFPGLPPPGTDRQPTLRRGLKRRPLLPSRRELNPGPLRAPQLRVHSHSAPRGRKHGLLRRRGPAHPPTPVRHPPTRRSRRRRKKGSHSNAAALGTRAAARTYLFRFWKSGGAARLSRLGFRLHSDRQACALPASGGFARAANSNSSCSVCMCSCIHILQKPRRRRAA